ncbi:MULTISPECIES: type IVB secretion system protein IcmH/DotU [Brenneria]|uniref:DotU family type IV/VI secretion system protein n=1 Tax=Brenneria nigrifluens DSM 30175 = ATCC 13028 TaxID=1121120 RepID=A0A2U1UK77_9GAMM|nr:MULTISPECIES: type IVB secretion system protein IcmH/DotU [Brenneria]EHD20409.1 type IV / VI secretion system protein, DotU family [Brenneria sp. EniD312]PWC22086.1 type IV secretion protein DotU [Brenneria nigrifluens DSM 30175 = ATCC 13028]QCR03612.1 DotU family type IV/VI secretion system protein [Brenneria nigrifluens DSM 30175 = ATCC 13028]
MSIEVIKNDRLGDLLYDHARQLDMDSDYWFRLRGHSINPMIDAVTPLLGMVNRVRQLSAYEDVADLYQRVVSEIQAIEQELHSHGYDNGVILSFRYILCTFIDEAVMEREWGGQSMWSAHSLLTRFHNETWGGEKVFVLLEKLLEDPARYRDILEFIYLCLCLGFEGRYRVMTQGHEELERVVRRLHGTLRPEPANPPVAFHLNLGRQAARYQLRRQLSLRSLFIGMCAVLAAAFGLYRYQLTHQTQDVLRQLGELLQ